MSETRKLAAILVAGDIGYSRLAGADEVDEQPERDGRSQEDRKRDQATLVGLISAVERRLLCDPIHYHHGDFLI